MGRDNAFYPFFLELRKAERVERDREYALAARCSRPNSHRIAFPSLVTTMPAIIDISKVAIYMKRQNKGNQ